MNRIYNACCVLGVSLIALHGMGAAAPASASETESYRGFLAATTHRFPRQISSAITLRGIQLSSPEETEQISALLKRGRPDALQNWYGGREMGTLQVGDNLPEPVAAAWSFSDDQGRHLVVLAPRRISFREIFGNLRSTDYPYTVAQLDLEPDGHGSGELTLAGRLEVDRTGHVSFEPLRVLPVRILGVRPLGE